MLNIWCHPLCLSAMIAYVRVLAPLVIPGLIVTYIVKLYTQDLTSSRSTSVRVHVVTVIGYEWMWDKRVELVNILQ